MAVDDEDDEAETDEAAGVGSAGRPRCVRLLGTGGRIPRPAVTAVSGTEVTDTPWASTDGLAVEGGAETPVDTDAGPPMAMVTSIPRATRIVRSFEAILFFCMRRAFGSDDAVGAGGGAAS